MKIRSITDVITNSSSEVFILRREDVPGWTSEGEESGCIDIVDPLTPEFFIDEEQALCDLMGWFPEDTGATLVESQWTKGRCWWSWNPELWEDYLKAHSEEISERISPLIWVQITDHYDWSSYELDSKRAEEVSIWGKDK